MNMEPPILAAVGSVSIPCQCSILPERTTNLPPFNASPNAHYEYKHSRGSGSRVDSLTVYLTTVGRHEFFARELHLMSCLPRRINLKPKPIAYNCVLRARRRHNVNVAQCSLRYITGFKLDRRLKTKARAMVAPQCRKLG